MSEEKTATNPGEEKNKLVKGMKDRIEKKKERRYNRPIALKPA